MSDPINPPNDTLNYTLNKAWTTLTTVATPSHFPVQKLAFSTVHHSSKPHALSYHENNRLNSGSSAHDINQHRHLKSVPDIVASGLGQISEQHLRSEPADLSIGRQTLLEDDLALMEHKHTGKNKIGAHVHPSMSIKSELPTKVGYESTSQVFQKRSSPESKPHIYPLQHAVSDRDVQCHVTPSFQMLGLSPPPSPGKLAMKYMEHLDNKAAPASSLRHDNSKSNKGDENSGTLTSAPVDLQERRVASPVKATALVAPYTGDVNHSNQGMHKSLKVTIPTSGNVSRTPGAEVSVKPAEGALVRAQSADKWKSLVETKDRILSQKNQLIERQKENISHLQQQVRELEERMHLLTTARALHEGGGYLNVKLKDLEYKSTSSRAAITELQSAKRKEVDALTKQLDAKEYELQKKTMELSQSNSELEAANRELKKQVDSQQSVLREIEQKLRVSGCKNKELSEHIVKLNSYFENMPTMEEHYALKDQAEHCNKLCATLTSQLSDKESSLKLSEEKLKQKEETITQLESETLELRKQLESTSAELAPIKQRTTSLDSENRKLVRECQRLQKLLFEADTHCRRELQAMRDRHKERFLEATADLRSKLKIAAKRIKLLEAQLLKNSDAMMALNSELQLSQGTIGELKSSMKELLSQNQQLVERNVSLQEVSSEASKVASAISEVQSVTAQQLAVELTQCIGDFESLVNLSKSLLEGQDPSASLVLGVRDVEDHSGMMATSETDITFAGSHEEKLQQVRKLQKEINQLREVVSDQFASQVSSACHVQ